LVTVFLVDVVFVDGGELVLDFRDLFLIEMAGQDGHHAGTRHPHHYESENQTQSSVDTSQISEHIGSPGELALDVVAVHVHEDLKADESILRGVLYPCAGLENTHVELGVGDLSIRA